jgi:peptide/nickel transport system permease protein
MIKWLGFRIAAMVPLLLFISFIAFVMSRLIPGSAAQVILGDAASPENIAALEATLGLDQPLLPSYLDWLSSALAGDLGQSLLRRQPVVELVVAATPPTLSITAGALIIGAVIGIGAGVVSGMRPGSWIDKAAMIGASIGLALPAFWIAVLLSLHLAARTGWFPTIGYASVSDGVGTWFRGILLPSIALGSTASAVVARQMRSSLIDALNTDYVRAARASGLPERQVVARYGLRNALIPVVTVIGLQVPVILGLAFVVEQVFAIPGIGRLAVDAVLDRDIPLLQGVVLATGLIVVLANLVVDASYGWLDPKVRVS